MYLFKGKRDTFDNPEWNFRDIGIQWFLEFGNTGSKCCMIFLLFQIYGIRDIVDPLPGPHKHYRLPLCTLSNTEQQFSLAYSFLIFPSDTRGYKATSCMASLRTP